MGFTNGNNEGDGTQEDVWEEYGQDGSTFGRGQFEWDE